MPFPDRPAENADPWYDERETYDQAIEDAVTTAQTKLAGIATGATANDTDANLKARANHTGTQTAATISDFDTEVGNHPDVAANTAARHTHANSAILAATTASFLTADETKLDGIATGATANATNAELRTRSSHTGTQLASTISDFASTVSAVTDVVNNTAARHTHSNKALLDTYTQTESNLADAVTKKHAHANSAVLDATTASFLTADETKLDGIEALADVTDAGNVGSSIHGATGKTTPVDADTMPLIDSAASNVLKKVTWANVKATAKTYFDTLYAPASVVSVPTGGTTKQVLAKQSATNGDAIWRDDTNSRVDWPSGTILSTDQMGPLIRGAANNLNMTTVFSASPIDIVSATAVTGILISVTAAAASGSLARLGIFTATPASGTGSSLTRVLDCGTVLVDAIAIVEATISITLDPGRYWLGGVANTTGSSWVAFTGVNGIPTTTLGTDGQRLFVSGRAADVAGGLQAIYGAGGTGTAQWATQLLRVGLRKA
jgi:hypothetical protein